MDEMDQLDKDIVEKYPLIFKNRYADKQITAMCWGLCIGKGWYPLVDTLCAQLYAKYNSKKSTYEWQQRMVGETKYNGEPYTQEEADEAKKEMDNAAAEIPVASQVKEKFGGLRFYVDRATKEHHEVIDFAERMSYHICEECGSMKDVQTWEMGWLTTLCKEHAVERYGAERVEAYLECVQNRP